MGFTLLMRTYGGADEIESKKPLVLIMKIAETTFCHRKPKFRVSSRYYCTFPTENPLKRGKILLLRSLLRVFPSLLKGFQPKFLAVY